MAIREVVININHCLTEGREELLNNCDTRLLKQLATCVLKTMDILYSMSQLHSMPTCLLWKIFYVLISGCVAMSGVRAHYSILVYCVNLL